MHSSEKKQQTMTEAVRLADPEVIGWRRGLLCAFGSGLTALALLSGPEWALAADVRNQTDAMTKAVSVFVPYGTITSVEGRTVNALPTQQSESSGIEFAVPSSLAPHLREGQPVWVNIQTNQAKVVKFPILGDRKERVKKGKGWWMKTEITISSTGRIDGETKTWSTEALRGFTGGVMVFLYDADGNVLHSTKLRKYGVNGTTMGPPDNRKDLWNEPVDPAVVVKTKKYAIVHKHSPTDRQDEFLEKAKKVVDIAATIASIISGGSGKGGEEGGDGGGVIGQGPTEPEQSQ